MKVLHSIWQQIGKTQQWPQDWKRSVFISIPKKGNAKECSNCCTTALISHTRLPCGSDGTASACNMGDLGSIPGLGRRKWQPTPVFLPGKSHGQKSLAGYSPWGRKESDTTEQLHFTLFYFSLNIDNKPHFHIK